MASFQKTSSDEQLAFNFAQNIRNSIIMIEAKASRFRGCQKDGLDTPDFLRECGLAENIQEELRKKSPLSFMSSDGGYGMTQDAYTELLGSRFGDRLRQIEAKYQSFNTMIDLGTVNLEQVEAFCHDIKTIVSEALHPTI